MSEISFAGLSAALSAVGMLLVAAVAAILECTLALRASRPRWRIRLVGPALFAVLAVVIFVLADSGPTHLKRAVDHWFVPVILLGLMVWVVLRTWPSGGARDRRAR